MSYRWIGLGGGIALTAVWCGLFWIASTGTRLLPTILMTLLQGGIGYWLGYRYEQMREQAYHDSLTGLLVNRRFLELLQREVERARRYQYKVTLMFIDLDNFKQYNDRHGHLAGDKLLSRLARLLRQTVRDQDEVGRWGGEEFVVLLPHTDTAQGLVVGKRIQVNVRKELPGVTVSIGVATFPVHADDATALVAYADKLMYEAKKKRDCMLSGPISG